MIRRVSAYLKPMIKRILFSIGAIFFILMAGVYFFVDDIDVMITETQAQSTIDAFLQKEPPESWGIRVNPQSFHIDFKSNNTAEITAALELDGHGYSGVFDGRFATGIDYRAPSLYLDNLTLLEGGFETDEDTQSELIELKNAAINVIQRKRNEMSAQSPELKFKTTTPDLVQDYTLRATQGVFENIPIYRIDRSGLIGTAASLALKEVSFSEETAIVTLSPKTAILRILAMIGMTLLVIIWLFQDLLTGYVFSRLSRQDNNNGISENE